MSSKFCLAYLWFPFNKRQEKRETKAPYSGVRESLYDWLIGRWGWCWKANPKTVIGPVEIRTAQTVGSVDGGGGIGWRESHHVTLSFHGKWWTLQKRMESWAPEAWFSWKGIGLFQGSLALESEARQAEVASTFTTTVAVKSSSVEAVGVRRSRSPAWTPLWDGGTGSSSRETNKQSPNKSSNYKYSCHGHCEGHYNTLWNKEKKEAICFVNRCPTKYTGKIQMVTMDYMINFDFGFGK